MRNFEIRVNICIFVDDFHRLRFSQCDQKSHRNILLIPWPYGPPSPFHFPYSAMMTRAEARGALRRMTMLCGGKYATLSMCTFLKLMCTCLYFMCTFCSVNTILLFLFSYLCGYNSYMPKILCMNSGFHYVVIMHMRLLI